jgi:hypothetical protein
VREIVCSVCGNQRLSLNSVNSDIVKTMVLSVCNTCLHESKEPRWLVILAFKSGYDVTHWVDNHLHEGERIEIDSLN